MTKEEQTFEQYLKQARWDFAKVAHKYPVESHLELRTAIDSFLIAYDQSSEQNKELIEKVEKLEAESVALGLHQSKEIQSEIKEKWEIINDANETIQQLQSQLSEAKKALEEAEIQLKYMDEKFPTGTTPSVLVRIKQTLQNLTTNT